MLDLLDTNILFSFSFCADPTILSLRLLLLILPPTHLSAETTSPLELLLDSSTDADPSLPPLAFLPLAPFRTDLDGDLSGSSSWAAPSLVLLLWVLRLRMNFILHLRGFVKSRPTLLSNSDCLSFSHISFVANAFTI